MRTNTLREELVPAARHRAIPLRRMEESRHVESRRCSILSYSVLYKMMAFQDPPYTGRLHLQVTFYFIFEERATEGPGWAQKHL